MTPYLVICLGAFSLIAIPKIRNFSLPLLILIAIITRATIFITGPTLSEDPYRYLWNGEKISRGENPYQTAPALEKENSRFYRLIKNQERPSIYFPLAEFLFFLAHLLSPRNFLGLKILILIADVITISLLYLYHRQKLGLYLLSPLVLIESYLGLHVDSFLLPLALGFIIFERKKPLLASTLLSISFLIKPIMIVIAPVFYYRHREGKIFIPLVIALLLALPYFKNSPLALKTYIMHWEFNASLYYFIKLLYNHSLYARIVSYSVFIGLYALFFPHRKSYPLILGAFFLCSPTVYPWYLLPLFAISVVIESPFLILCYTALFSYSVLIPYRTLGLWQENWIFIVLEYLPVYLLMIKHFSVVEKFFPSTFKKYTPEGSCGER